MRGTGAALLFLDIGEHIGGVATHALVLFALEKNHAGRIDIGDHAMRVDRHHAVIDGLENCAIERGFLPELFRALGDLVFQMLVRVTQARREIGHHAVQRLHFVPGIERAPEAPCPRTERLYFLGKLLQRVRESASQEGAQEQRQHHQEAAQGQHRDAKPVHLEEYARVFCRDRVLERADDVEGQPSQEQYAEAY